MVTSTMSIFRKEALEYRARQQGRQFQADVAFPRLMARRAWVTLWALVVALAIAGTLACLPTVSVRAGALAVATTGEAPRIAVLAPGESTEIRPGAEVTLRLGEREVPGTVTAVEPAPMAPAEAAQRLGLPWSAVSMLTGPVTVAWVAPDAAVTPGALGSAEVDTGSRRAGSYLPLVGRFFRSDA